MATPTDTEIWAQLGQVVEHLDDYEASIASTLVANHDAIVEGFEGDYIPSVLPQLNRMRASLASPLARPFLAALFRPFLQEFAKVYGWPSATASNGELMRRLREQMAADSDSLNSNEHTIDTSFSGSTTGSGTLYRLTVDKDGNQIEGIVPGGTQTFEVIRDARGGRNGSAQVHAEVFEYRGADKDLDELTYTAAGVVAELTSASASVSRPYVRNASFESNTATNDDTALTADSDVTDWTFGTATNFALRSDDTFRGLTGAKTTDTTWALEINANDNCSQILQDKNSSLRFRDDVPYHVGYAAKKRDSGDGTLTGAFGGTDDGGTTVSGLSSWTHVPITSGANCWLDNFNEANLDITFTLGSRTTGSVMIDDIIVTPYTWIPEFGWVVIIGGETPWVRGDTKTLTDAFGGTRGKISYWLARAYGDLIPEMRGWLPVVTSSESISDPA